MAYTPATGTAGAFGVTPAWIGWITGDVDNDVTLNPVGHTRTTGDNGRLTGNILVPEAVPVA